LLAGLSVLGGLWATCIVLPLTVGIRRLLGSTRSSRVFSYVSVVALSGVAFSFFPPASGPWSPALVYVIGGLIGLATVRVVDLMMSPDKSLGRSAQSREGSPWQF